MHRWLRERLRGARGRAPSPSRGTQPFFNRLLGYNLSALRTLIVGPFREPRPTKWCLVPPIRYPLQMDMASTHTHKMLRFCDTRAWHALRSAI
jgi:hypothetical protein